MRDLIVISLVLAASLSALKRPWIGVLAWAWVSLMNPHRFSWGFAYDFPVAMLIAVCTLLGMLFHSKELQKVPLNGATLSWLLFLLWLNLAAPFSINLTHVFPAWEKIIKIMVMLFFTMALIIEKRQIQALIWIVALSIGLLGLKGGVFTVIGGGGDRVWGPPGSFIEGNNEVGLAFVVIVPLLYYLFEQTRDPRVRWAVAGMVLACVIAALGTHSRGALLATAAMAALLWMKSPKKVATGLVIAILIPVIYTFMPAEWHNRMSTIGSYEQDSSAMGRINAWQMAFNIANDNFFGGGLDIYTADIYYKYAPIPDVVRAAHSIYFQILGELGWIGLLLFLCIWFFTWRLAARLINLSKGQRDLLWITSFARMAQVSLVGFAVGGAFLSLAYFDLPYYLIVIMTVMERWLKLHHHVTQPPAWQRHGSQHLNRRSREAVAP